MLNIGGHIMTFSGSTLGTNFVDFPRLSRLQLDVSQTDLVALGWPFSPGVLQPVDAAPGSQSWVAKLSGASVDFLDLPHMFNMKRVVSPVVAPQAFSATVASGVISVPGLVANQLVYATTLSATSPQRLTQVLATATPTGSQFSVGTDQLNFPTAFNGSIVGYMYFATTSSIPNLGGTNAVEPVGAVSFYGTFGGPRTRFGLYIPSMTLSGNRTVQFGNAEVVQRQYTLTTIPGWNAPMWVFEK